MAEVARADGVGETIAVTARMMAASPSLRGRQEEILAGHTRAHAQLLAAETGGDTAVRALVTNSTATDGPTAL